MLAGGIHTRAAAVSAANTLAGADHPCGDVVPDLVRTITTDADSSLAAAAGARETLGL